MEYRAGVCGATIAAIISMFGTVCHAGCPNDSRKLDDRAQQAAEAFNKADASHRCVKARELVSAEQKLFRFVDNYQIQCVLDQEIIDVQQRRRENADAAREQACGQ